MAKLASSSTRVKKDLSMAAASVILIDGRRLLSLCLGNNSNARYKNIGKRRAAKIVPKFELIQTLKSIKIAHP